MKNVAGPQYDKLWDMIKEYGTSNKINPGNVGKIGGFVYDSVIVDDIPDKAESDIRGVYHNSPIPQSIGNSGPSETKRKMLRAKRKKKR